MAPAEGMCFALPKGRLLRSALPLLAKAGCDLGDAKTFESTRLLQLDAPGGHRVLLVKPSDVPTYVERGVADVGIAGLDTLEEDPRDLYRPVDLGIAKCRLVVAEPDDRRADLRRGGRIRVASKYPRLAARHYAVRGVRAEVVQLYGSVELGAITGLADQIVDLVESGETLRQNRLVEVETILDVSARLVVHPASYKLRHRSIGPLIEGLRRVCVGDEVSA